MNSLRQPRRNLVRAVLVSLVACGAGRFDTSNATALSSEPTRNVASSTHSVRPSRSITTELPRPNATSFAELGTLASTLLGGFALRAMVSVRKTRARGAVTRP